MKKKETKAKKPTTKKTTAKKSAATTKKATETAKKSTTKATVTACGQQAAPRSSAKNRSQTTSSSATKRNTKKSAVKAATPAKNSVKKATTTKLKTKVAQVASQNPKIKVGDTVLSMETGYVGGIQEIKIKKNAHKKPTPHAVIHWQSIDGVPADKPLTVEVSEFERMGKDGIIIIDHRAKPKVQPAQTAPKSGTKADYMAKHGITIRPVTAEDRKYARTDYQRVADYIISIKGKEFFSAKGTLADCKDVVKWTKN